jgi:hypothetical protein
MASYAEIRNLFNDSDLLNKVTTATIIYAHSAIASATANQKKWIAQALQSPTSEAKKILMGVLAANKDLEVSAIQGATDAVIQAQVDLIAPILIDALAGV